MQHWRLRILAASGPGLALLLITAVVLFVTWPQALLLRSHVGSHEDALFSVWRLSWIAHSLASPSAQLFDAPIFYPYKDTLAYSDAILLSGLLTAPSQWLGVAPFTVYNGYLLFSFIASGFAAALLCQRLSGSWLAAAVGGVIFTASPHRLEHFERLELITSAAIPLAFYCWHIASGKASRRWFAAACVCVAGQWYLGMYQAVFLATVMTCLVIDWWTLDAPTKRLAVQGAAVGAFLTVLLVAPSTLPYLRAQQEVGERSASDVAAYSGEWRNFLGVHQRSWLYGEHLSKYGAPERNFFPGAAAAILAIAGALLAPRKIALLYGAVLLVGVEITLGSNGFLFPLLREFAPPYRGMRSPARADIVVLLPIAVFASIAVSRALARLNRPPAVAILCTLLAIIAVEYRTPPILWDAPRTQFSPWTPPADAVLLEYPITQPARLDLNLDAHYMVGRLGSWPKMLNGYSGHYPRGYIQLLEGAADFPSERAIAEIVFRGATHLLVHEQWLENRYPGLVELLTRMPQLELVGAYKEPAGEVAIFRLRAARLR